MRVLRHFKHQDSSGITFVGFDTDRCVYSTAYYANVGIMNAAESKPTTLREVKRLIKKCVDSGYEEVVYLK